MAERSTPERSRQAAREAVAQAGHPTRAPRQPRQGQDPFSGEMRRRQVVPLLVFRFLIGLGLGAELPVASTLVSEFAPARLRPSDAPALVLVSVIFLVLGLVVELLAPVLLLGAGGAAQGWAPVTFWRRRAGRCRGRASR